MLNRKSSTTLARARVVALLLLPGLWSASARAQMCGDTFLSQGDNTLLIRVDTSTNPWTFNDVGTAGLRYNAMSYRPENDTLYAILTQQGPADLLQVNAGTGSTTNLGEIDSSDGFVGANAGAFGPDGFLYAQSGAGGPFFRIDVDMLTATEVSGTDVGNIPDISWFDGRFYGVDNSDGQLKAFDPVAETIETIGPTGVSDSFGAMFSASTGVFGVSNEGSGAYQFDIETGEATLISDAPGSSVNDGARCLEAPLDFLADVSLTKDDGSDTYLPGEDVVYEIVVTNNGPFGVQNAEVSDPLPDGIDTASWTCTDGANGGACGAPSGSGPIVDTPDLPVDATVTYELTITVPSGFSGDLENNVTVVLPEGFNDPNPGDNSATDINTSGLEPGISLEKSAEGAEPLEVGDTIEYSFLVTNTGNATLTEIEITDPLVSPVTCPQTELEPKADMTCTGSYTVTQADVDAGVVENTAEVSGAPEGGQPPVTDEGTAVFPPDQAPGISLEKSGSGPEPLTVGATIEYEFLVTNTGNVTLTEVTVEDPLDGLSPVDCPDDTLAPGAEMTCTATYEVTQADVEAGVIENTATATGQTPTGGPPPTDTSTTTFPPEEPVPALPPLAFVLLVVLLTTATLWTLRRASA